MKRARFYAKKKVKKTVSFRTSEGRVKFKAKVPSKRRKKVSFYYSG